DTLMQSDCLIVFGASLNKHTAADGGILRNKRVVQINPLPEHIGKYFSVDAGVVGDPGLVAEALMELLDMAEIPGSGARTDDLRADLEAHHRNKSKLGHKKPGTVNIYKALQLINDVLPKDRVYV